MDKLQVKGGNVFRVEEEVHDSKVLKRVGSFEHEENARSVVHVFNAAKDAADAMERGDEKELKRLLKYIKTVKVDW